MRTHKWLGDLKQEGNKELNEERGLPQDFIERLSENIWNSNELR